MTEGRVIVFVRAPRWGQVKTRLAAQVGPDRALAIYRELLTATAAALASSTHVELRHTPDDAGEELDPWKSPGWTLAGQGTGDLGERLTRAVSEAFAAGESRVAVIGSDCPDLTADDLREAWAALEWADVVLGPAVDGGYWLIGLRRPVPELFEGIPWSTAGVRSATEAVAARLGLRIARLRELRDVDEEG